MDSRRISNNKKTACGRKSEYTDGVLIHLFLLIFKGEDMNFLNLDTLFFSGDVVGHFGPLWWNPF